MRTLLFLIVLGSVAHAGRVVVLTDRADLPVALETEHIEAIAQPMVEGETAIDRAAAAQHVAMANNASAAVWVDNNEVWVVSGDGRVLRHAPLADASSSRVFAAIAASLLDELIAPPESTVHVSVDVAPPAPVPVALPAGADVVAVAPVVEPIGQHPSPRVEISVGGFAASRGMTFAQNPPDFPATPPSYPSTGLGGIGFNAAVFPSPETPYGDDLTGWGATLEIQTSLSASIAANDTVNDTYGDYGLSYNAWEFGGHYRHKVGRWLFDGMASYGRASWTLASDFPSSVQIPDTSYQYLGAGGKIELTVGNRATFGIGGRYMYIISSGNVSDMDWYGTTSASGLGADAEVKLPISGALYLRGMVEYRRVAMSFTGDGNLSTPEDGSSLAVSGITDSWIMAGTELGMSF